MNTTRILIQVRYFKLTDSKRYLVFTGTRAYFNTITISICMKFIHNHLKYSKKKNFINLAQVVWQRKLPNIFSKHCSFQATCRVNLINANLCYR